MYLLESDINNSQHGSGSMPLGSPAKSVISSLLRAGLVTTVCYLFGTPAWSATLSPFVSANVEHDDNLFRYSENQLRQLDDGADTFRTVTAGLKLNRTISRQIFTGVADFSSVKFDRNNQLDYVGKDFKGDWNWFVAKHFEGHIGGAYTKTLASFADFHSDQGNLFVTKKQYVDGSWRFHPSWRWVNSYNQDQYFYDSVSQRINNRTEDQTATGVDYLARSGSTIGIQLRKLKGAYPNLQSSSTGFFANNYVQNEAKLNALWLVTGTTQILFLGGWAQRKQTGAIERVNSGTNARLIVNGTAAGRMQFSAQAFREFAAIDGALIDTALVSGESAVATWDFSAKIQALIDLRHETRQFTPFSGTSAALASTISSDKSGRSSIGLIYKPLRTLTFKVTGFQEQRTGSVAAGTNSYKDKGATFSVTQQFW